MAHIKAKKYEPPMKVTKNTIRSRHNLAIVMANYRKMGYHDAHIAKFLERDDKSGRHWVRSDIQWYIDEYLDIDI